MNTTRRDHEVRTTSAAQSTPSRTVGADALPPEIREYSGLERIDFADQVTASGVPSRSAEQWARAIVGDVPNLPEKLIWQGVLRARLDHRRSADLIAGWRIAHREQHRIRLETTSPVMGLRVIITADDDQVTLTTCVRFDTLEGKARWKLIEPLHGFADPRLVATAARKETDRVQMRNEQESTA